MIRPVMGSTGNSPPLPTERRQSLDSRISSRQKILHFKDQEDGDDSMSQQFIEWTSKMSNLACVHPFEPTTMVEETQNHQQQQKDYIGPNDPCYHFGVVEEAMFRQCKHQKYGGRSHDEMDMQTLATASTAAASSLSYSTAEEHPQILEAGTEVVMRSHSLDDPSYEPYQPHQFIAGKEVFTVDSRYEFGKVVGSGAYGVVISATDHQTNETRVAIKKIPSAFKDDVDAKRILREIKLIKHFDHENIITLVDMMPPNVDFLQEFNDVYMVTDLMETDLHRIIYSKQPLTIEHAQYFIYQTLRGLKYIHSAKVIHRDIKPSNLLVNANCDLKICDFGLARGLRDRDENEKPLTLTEYVVTRWYRAPEIMLACKQYSYPVDIWSVGCVFAELILRKPLFAGEDYVQQLLLISELFGKMKEEDMDFISSEKAKRFLRKLPDYEGKSLLKHFAGAPSDAVDSIRCMLQMNPGKRQTVEQAVAHPFFRTLHSLDEEPTANSEFDFSFEDETPLPRARLRELIWNEIGELRPSCLPVKKVCGSILDDHETKSL